MSNLLCIRAIVESLFNEQIESETKNWYEEDKQHFSRRVRELGDSNENQNSPRRKEPTQYSLTCGSGCTEKQTLHNSKFHTQVDWKLNKQRLEASKCCSSVPAVSPPHHDKECQRRENKERPTAPLVLVVLSTLVTSYVAFAFRSARQGVCEPW